MTTSPLSGIRVLDLTRVLAGPLCSMMLGDLGADVIKVERPEGGDETRGWGPPFDDEGESAYFLSVNRNKRSVTADFRVAEDRQLIRTLAMGADVLIENFLPSALSRLGLDAASMLKDNEGLILCSIRGYSGQSDRPGYDFAVQAEAGWLSVTGDPEGALMKTAVALVDVLAGKDAAIAILAALAGRRHRPAAERHLVVTLQQSALAGLVNVAQNVLVSGRDAARWGNAHANLVPYQLFETADRPLVIAVGSDGQWQALTRILGDEILAGDEGLRTNAGRVANRARVVDGVQRALRAGTSAEWIVRCAAVGVPVGEVRTVAEALAGSGASPSTGVPSSIGGAVFRRPPKLGEHSEQIRQSGWATPSG